MSKVEFLKQDEGDEPIPYQDAMLQLLGKLDERLSQDGWGQPSRLFVMKMSKLLDVTGLSLEAIPYEIESSLDFCHFSKHMFLIEMDRFIDRALGLDQAEGYEAKTPLDELVSSEFVAMVLVHEHEPVRDITFLDVDHLALNVRRAWVSKEEDMVTVQQGKTVPENTLEALYYVVMAAVLAVGYQEGGRATLRTVLGQGQKEADPS